ncbi:LamB/YcsF family protein [Alienimonas californiensis]|uniref:LamB/YcsF family protein n=1 Tax=Alienimonas californiensis TaxID=2527989 RepID=A0A517PB82_9PLAN|nr:LamB/YcsF family protein [Alienimonas californiensis]QDT16622.1 LamB/YcsF family protein [Alienimonas californiensis]
MDLNADVGETTVERDRRLLPYLTSCNVSCGAHAGGAELIVATVREAVEWGVPVGAHPSYPDRPGFGRRSVPISDARLEAELLFQIATVKSLVEAFGARLRHVKPHGALYHDVRSPGPRAGVLIAAVKRIAPDAAIVGQAGSPLDELAIRQGLAFRHEAFADRRYAAADALVPRSDPRALIETEDEFRDHLGDLLAGHVRDAAGERHVIPVDTICLHGDSPHAVHFAQIARGMIDGRTNQTADRGGSPS